MNRKELSIQLIRFSILLYVIWLLLPAVQTTGRAVSGCACVGLFGLGVLLGLVLHMDYIGFWLGDALAGYTPFFIGLVYYFTGSWKTRKYVIKEEKASS